MSSDASFVEYVQGQLSGAGVIGFRRMFGEYAMYCDAKVVALVCDNQLFVKPTISGRALLGAAARDGVPYPGAKPWLLIGDELEDRLLLSRLIRATAAELPLPKPKTPKPPPAAPGARRKRAPAGRAD
jgi:TfoX/Sxy family transcriptional regulator of competence genes